MRTSVNIPRFVFSGLFNPPFINAMCNEWRRFEIHQTKQVELFTDEEIYDCFYTYLGYSI